MQEEIYREIKASADLKQAVLADMDLQQRLADLAGDCIRVLKAGGKIFFCGNGGSFADAQHLAAELVSRLRFNRDAVCAISLGTNSSNLTAIGNDYGYEQVFARELKALGRPGDLLIAISTSGNSPNVLKAVVAAKNMGIITYGWTGQSGGKMADVCHCIKVPSVQTDKIQEVHIMLGHIVCHLIEKTLFSNT
jgi:D-sedoheptulose 7-phosphate isomerase